MKQELTPAQLLERVRRLQALRLRLSLLPVAVGSRRAELQLRVQRKLAAAEKAAFVRYVGAGGRR